MTNVFLIVFAAVTSIVAGDTAGKLLGAMGVAPLFTAWSRFALGALLLLPIVRPQTGEWRRVFARGALVRGLLITGAICCMLTALRTEEIANVFGAFFVSPIVAFILSAIFLREQVSAARVVLLITGFIGVLLVVKPGFGATWGLGIALIGGSLHGCYLTLTRALAHGQRPLLLVFSQLLVGAVVLMPLGITQVPQITPSLAGLLVISTVGSFGGNLFLVLAGRIAPAGIVAPLIYTQIVSAIGFGVVVFGDFPDRIALFGLAVILASGLGTLMLARKEGLVVGQAPG